MSHSNYFAILWSEWKKIVLIGVVVGLLAAGFSFVRPLEYSSTIRLLVVPRSTFGLDPYLAIRSSERISENLASIVYTNSFFEKVLSLDTAIDQNYFSTREIKKRREWQRMVSTQVARGGGLLAVTVYHRDRSQAERMVSAMGSVLQSEGWTYVGGGDLQIQLVDTPLTSRFPVRPNITLNALGGLILGIVATAAWITHDAHRRRDHHQGGFLHES